MTNFDSRKNDDDNELCGKVEEFKRHTRWQFCNILLFPHKILQCCKAVLSILATVHFHWHIFLSYSSILFLIQFSVQVPFSHVPSVLFSFIFCVFIRRLLDNLSLFLNIYFWSSTLAYTHTHARTVNHCNIVWSSTTYNATKYFRNRNHSRSRIIVVTCDWAYII